MWVPSLVVMADIAGAPFAVADRVAASAAEGRVREAETATLARMASRLVRPAPGANGCNMVETPQFISCTISSYAIYAEGRVDVNGLLFNRRRFIIAGRKRTYCNDRQISLARARRCAVAGQLPVLRDLFHGPRLQPVLPALAGRDRPDLSAISGDGRAVDCQRSDREGAGREIVVGVQHAHAAPETAGRRGISDALTLSTSGASGAVAL